VPAVVARLSEKHAPQGVATPYSVFFCIGQDPLETHQEALVQDLRAWHFQFSSFADSPIHARAETAKIVDYLTGYHDADMPASFLLPGTRIVDWEQDTRLAHSHVDLMVWDSLDRETDGGGDGAVFDESDFDTEAAFFQ
jgi:hypothetical protein